MSNYEKILNPIYYSLLQMTITAIQQETEL